MGSPPRAPHGRSGEKRWLLDAAAAVAALVQGVAMRQMGRHGVPADVDDVGVGRVARRDVAHIDFAFSAGKSRGGSEGSQYDDEDRECKFLFHAHLSLEGGGSAPQ